MKQGSFIIVLALLIFSKGFSQNIKEFYIECNVDSFQYIYDHYEQDYYIPISISHNGITLTNARMRIRGDGSRVFPKKSLKVKLDAGNFGNSITTYNFNAEWEDKSYIQAYIQSVFFKLSGLNCFNIEHVRLYLNGNYLGLYVYVQNMDEDFLIDNNLNRYGDLYKATLDGASLSIYDNVYYHWEQKNGFSNGEDLQELILNLDTVADENYYSFLNTHFEYDKLINFFAVSLLTRNYSTYYHNYFMFHDVFGSGKWTVFPWDLDKSFLYYEYNILYYHTSRYWAPDNPLMEKVFFNNMVFNDLKTRIDSLHLYVINDSTASIIIDSLKTELMQSVVDDQTDNITDISIWENYINNSKTAFNNRYGSLQFQFDNYPRSFRVTRIKELFTSSEPITFSWTSCDVPSGEIPTYSVFFGTNPNLDSFADTIIESITDTFLVLENNFTEGKYYYKVMANTSIKNVEGFNNYNITFIDSDSSDIVINEINYNSSAVFNPEDWIELYNNSTFPVNISGWKLSDKSDAHFFTIPEGITIEPDAFLILSFDYLKFENCFPDVVPVLGNIGFGFSNSGEKIRLFNKYGRLKDIVNYKNSSPWPSEPNGTGSVLMLKTPELDNSLAENWIPSISNGTPGRHNLEDSTTLPVFSGLNCFPNPMEDVLTVYYESNSNSTIELSLFDISGKRIFSKVMHISNPGKYSVKINTQKINSGIYFFVFKENSFIIESKKLVKLN